MNKIEEFERGLKVAYLNYENNDLKETLKYLNRMVEIVLKEDESLENDLFWKTLTCDVFKAIVLNNFYNKNELDGNKLDTLLADESLMKTNIKEFCHNFRNNELINFINHIENIADNPLKDVIKILMSNIGKMNIKIETTDDKALKENKIQKIDCFCGKTFELDWDKIPNTEKFTYVRCPFCDSERKLKNMYFELGKDKKINSYNNIKNEELPSITQNDVIEVIDNQEFKTTSYDIINNTENVISKQNISYFKNEKEFFEEQSIFAFSILDKDETSITIKTNPMCEVIDGKINLNNAKTEFKLYKNKGLILSTPTMDRGYTYKISIEKGNIDSFNELMDYVKKHDDFLEENKVLTFLKTLTADEINNIIFYAIDYHFVAMNLVKLIINNYGVEIMPKNIKWREKNHDEFDDIEAGMYAFLCREWSMSIANSYAKEKAKKYEELIVFLKNKGFDSDLTLSITGDGYHSGEKYNYTDVFNKITENQRNKGILSPNELTGLMNHIQGNDPINTGNNELNLVAKNIENVFETWNEIKSKNLELKDFFEETEKESINELIYAKDKATIKGKKLSEYLKEDNPTCNDKNIQLIISYFGFQSLYDMHFTNDGNIPCEEISVDNVGLFRAILMINIIAKLDSIISIGLPLNVKFTFERKEFAEILSPMLNYYLPKIFNNIKEIKILYK